MKWIYRLERKLGYNFGVPNLMMYVTGTMLAVYMLTLLIMPGLMGMMVFHRGLFLDGEIWRVVTFLLLPPRPHEGPLWVVITLFVTYRIGTALEQAWGTTRFTLYLLLGFVGAVAAGFITGFGVNTYIYFSLILAFCYMYSNATFLLFFILPVKAKYIAIFIWALFGLAFIQGNFASRVAIIFSLINFFLFFGPDVWNTATQNYKAAKRRHEYRKNWGENNPWR